MAKASSLADNLAKELECAVCLEQYKEPKVLTCLHSFCKTCLGGLLNKQGEVWRINCPACRLSVEIPQGDIESMPANFFLNNLLSMIALHGDSDRSNLECDICDSGDPPVNRCTTCCHFLCNFCTAGHKRGRSTKTHRLLSLEEAKEEGPIAVARPAFCKEHEGEMVKLFCETCDEAICRDCTIVKHRDHKYTFVKDVFAKGKDSVMKLLSETKANVSTLQRALDGISKMERSIQSHVEQTVQDVTKCFHDLAVSLNTRCEEVINGVEELKKSKLESLKMQRLELETALGIVQSGIEFTEKAFKNGSEVEILNMRKQMSCRLQELNSAKWQLEPCVGDSIKFKADKQLKQEVATFGVITNVATYAGASTVTMGHGLEGVMYNTLCGQSVEFTIIAKERNGRNRTEGGDHFIAGCHHGTEVEFLDVRDCGDGTYTFLCTPDHEGQYKLIVKLMGHDVSGSPFPCFVEKWHLLCISGCSEGHIKLSEENLTAKYKLLQETVGLSSLFGTGSTEGFDLNSTVSSNSRFKRAVRRSGRGGWGSPFPVSNAKSFGLGGSTFGLSTSSAPLVGASVATGFSSATFDGVPQGFGSACSRGNNGRQFGTDRWPYVVSSICFSTGKHSCKAKLLGHIQEGFSFGIISSSRGSHGTLDKLGNWWVWNSKRMKNLLSSSNVQIQESTITNCASNDVIEMYLDCDASTLVMYNQRTKQSDIWHGVEKDVCPVFHMTTYGDEVSLLV